MFNKMLRCYFLLIFKDLNSRWQQYVCSHVVFDSYIAECSQWLEGINSKLQYCSDLSASSQKDLEGKFETIQVCRFI